MVFSDEKKKEKTKNSKVELTISGEKLLELLEEEEEDDGEE